jgi:hypothetical protein
MAGTYAYVQLVELFNINVPEQGHQNDVCVFPVNYAFVNRTANLRQVTVR